MARRPFRRTNTCRSSKLSQFSFLAFLWQQHAATCRRDAAYPSIPLTKQRQEPPKVLTPVPELSEEEKEEEEGQAGPVAGRQAGCGCRGPVCGADVPGAAAACRLRAPLPPGARCSHCSPRSPFSRPRLPLRARSRIVPPGN